MNTKSLSTAMERGFTAAITAAALLLAWSAVVPARDKSAEVCLSNLRQLGIASRMYSDDYDGYLVPYYLAASTGSVRSSKLLLPYVAGESIFRCPSDHLSRSIPNSPPVPTTYGVNWYLSGVAGSTGGSTYPGSKYSSLKDPARTIWSADSAVVDSATMNLNPQLWREVAKDAQKADIYYFYLPQNPNTGATDNSWNGGSLSVVRPFPRHHGKVNCAFYDGHASPVDASQFDKTVTKWGEPGCLWDNVAG